MPVRMVSCMRMLGRPGRAGLDIGGDRGDRGDRAPTARNQCPVLAVAVTGKPWTKVAGTVLKCELDRGARSCSVARIEGSSDKAKDDATRRVWLIPPRPTQHAR